MQELQVDRTLVTKVISGKWFQCEIVRSGNLVGGKQISELSKTVDGLICTGNSSAMKSLWWNLKTEGALK